uniref:Uncharacterized protein n=1 Tax=Castor canadensis TaxID=51338 RepID=A0A8C0ZN74_CASCN
LLQLSTVLCQMKPVFRKLAPQLTQLYGKDVNFSSGAQDLMLQCYSNKNSRLW